MTAKKETLFERLSGIDVSGITEKKNGLTYLSWAHAWRLFKRECPDATYKVSLFDSANRVGGDTIKVPYMADPHTGYMCHTSVTVAGETHEMWLPVMDFRNKGLKEEEASMFDVNKTLMRCLVKNLAMFGLGIYIYAGEDLPSDSGESTTATPKKAAAKKTPAKKSVPAKKAPAICEKWDEWVVPFPKSPRHKQSLGEIVMEGAVEDLRKMRKYIKDVAKSKQGDESYDYWCKSADFCTEAVQAAEAEGGEVADEDVPF